MNGPHSRVLVLGGGDGMAVRELLRYSDVEQITLVDLDAAVVELAREDERVRSLNEDSLADPRVETLAADAFAWLRSAAVPHSYDTIVVDLPDPDDVATAKLYTVEFYGLLERALAPGGRTVIQSGSPYFAPEAYWGVAEAVCRGGLAVTPYHVDVPSFGDWGYLLAGRPGEEHGAGPADGSRKGAGAEAGASASAALEEAEAAGEEGSCLRGEEGGAGPRLGLSPEAPSDLRFASPEVLAAAAIFPPDRALDSVGTPQASTLMHPYVIDQQRRAWIAY